MLKSRFLFFVAVFTIFGLLAFSSSGCGDDEPEGTIPAALSLSISPSTLSADGISTAIIRIQGRQEGGEAIPDGTQVQVSTAGEYGMFDNGDIKIDARFKNGETYVVFVAGTEPGFGFIGAQVASYGLSAGARITLLSAHVLNKDRGEDDDDDNNDDE